MNEAVRPILGQDSLTQIAANHSEVSVFEGSSFFPVRVCVLQIFV